MTPTQKLQLEQSKVRSDINKALSTPESDRAESWSDDLEKLTKRAENLEIEVRAALVAGDPETKSETETETPEDKELADLMTRSSIEDYLAESVFDEKLDGASLELRQHLELPPNNVPLDLLERRDVDGQGLEQRADAATNVSASDAPQENQSGIAGRIFARTAGAYMGVARPTVPVGTSTYVALSTGATGDVRSDGVAKDAEAATFSTKSVDPVRVTGRYLFGIESAARLRGMEEALRSDLTALLGDKLDALALNGQAAVANVSPAVEGLIANTANPTDPGAVVVWNAVLKSFSDRIDGKYSEDGMNVRLLVNPETLRKFHELRIGTGNAAPLLQDSLPAGRLRASANMPAKTGEIAKALAYAASERRGFVQPIWRGVSIIRDPYTKAAEGQVALTIVMLAGAAMVDAGPYTQLEYKLA